jgi:hypothetical protein
MMKTAIFSGRKKLSHALHFFKVSDMFLRVWHIPNRRMSDEYDANN